MQAVLQQGQLSEITAGCGKMHADTYSSEGGAASATVYFLCKPPAVEVEQCSECGLGNFRRSNEQFGSNLQTQAQEVRELRRRKIDSGKDCWMQERPQLASPLLQAS
jgi:hypothetical protein